MVECIEIGLQVLLKNKLFLKSNRKAPSNHFPSSRKTRHGYARGAHFDTSVLKPVDRQR